MMNIRTASLDPNAPKASRDCRVCNRRRIKCDRTLPSCKKCGIRNLECSGFDRKLKWDQGIASRGQYAGQNAPIPRKALSPDKKVESESPKSQSTGPESADTVPSSTQTDSSLVRIFSNDESSIESDQVVVVDAHYGVDLSLSWSQLPHVFHDLDVRRLVNHYDHHVATTFVWIDSPENQWRNDILPLAQESPSLLSAILALSSSHLSSKLLVNEPFSAKLSQQADRYRDHSLQLLVQQLGENSQENHMRKSLTSIMATMLILCNLEMVQSDSAVWRVHLQASHTMIRRWLSIASPTDLLDSTSRFVISQFSILDTFASLSSFSGADEVSDVELAKGEPTIFSDYLETVHAITIEERKRAAIRQYGGILANIDVNLFAGRLQDARVTTQNLSRHFYFRTVQLRREFDQVVDVYHNAGLIYAYQALAEPLDAATSVPRLLYVLLKDLARLSAGGRYAQDLAWPLFISGTGCRRLKDEQVLVERLFQESMKSTGFSSCQEALKFLRVFWAENYVERDNWIDFARNYSRRGQEFLIF